MRAAVEALDVRKHFGDFVAVAGVTFSVGHGECYGILGPNGAGKTSLIRMMYGFSPLTSGRLRLFGLDIADDWRRIRSRIGVCQQENTLDPDLNIEQNLRLFASYFSMPSRSARERTKELLAFLALEKKRTARVMELSGGLARRLMLARALINQPELVILDEPTVGLDPQSRHVLWDRLSTLRREGMTLILTTHYMEEAAHLCDRLMILDRGRILVEGAPDELVREHAGDSVIEVKGPGEGLLTYLSERSIRHDSLEERVIIYADASVGEEVRARFCTERCTFRTPSLEDVFLRLTGRELRE